METQDRDGSGAGTPAAAPGHSVLRDRNVVLYLMASFSATGATAMMATALGKHVYDITGRKLDLGFVGLAEFLPAAVLVLVSGSVADRFDRRRVVAVTLAAELVVAGALAWYAGTGPSAVGPIFALVVAFGIARAFSAPASRAIPASIAPHGGLSRVVAVNSAVWQSSIIVGPVLGGFLYLGSPSWPYLGSVVLFAVAAPCMLAVEYRTDQIRSGKVSWHTAQEGLRFIKRTPILLSAIALDLFAVLFGGAVALLPAIAEDHLRVDADGLGVLRAAGGIGAAIVALSLAARPITRRLGRVLLVAVAVFGVATIVLGVTRSFVVALAMMALLSASDMVSVYIRGTLVPLATPEEMRGRVIAVENVFIGASNELGAFESGVVGQALGTTGAVVSGGVATLVVVGVWWFRFPVLRDVDSFDDVIADRT